jgi:hypothetical protein
MIHQLACAPKQDKEAERRGGDRRAFFADHRIAPVEGDELPDESAFVRVRCHDLTRSGFSFYLPRRPDFTSLVAALGEPPEVIYIRARVMHCATVVVHPLGLVEHVQGQPGSVNHETPTGEPVLPMVLVGCRFTHRLNV